jgi:hypothetical protein
MDPERPLLPVDLLVEGNGPNLVFVSEDTDGEEITRYLSKHNLHFSTFVSPTAAMRNARRHAGLDLHLPRGAGGALTWIVDHARKISRALSNLT